jgi:hypothetical protein
VKKGVGKTTVGYTFIVSGGGDKTTHRRIADNQKWKVDEHAKGRLSVDGRVRRKKGTVGCVSLMTQHHTNYVVSLLTT